MSPIALLFATALLAQTQRTQVPLAENWRIRQLDAPADPAALAREAFTSAAWLSARMPAQVHDILLQHKRIPDPHRSDNAAKVKWVADHDWAYATRFPAPPKRPVFLVFRGLDTLATAYLNGVEIGRFDNMYRQYRIDVSQRLQPENVLLLVFRSPTRFLAELQPPAAHAGHIPKTRYLRKTQPDFSAYLGARPDMIKIGVFREVLLDSPGPAWLEDVHVQSALSPDFRNATLRVRVTAAGVPGSLEYRLLDPAGAELARGPAQPGADFTIPVRNPQLWWPRLYGAQPLYKLAVTLRAGGAVADARETTIGIRDIKPVLKDPATGEPRFRFDVNGRPIYFRGACLTQIDHLSQTWQPDRARRLLDLAEHANMNLLRIWGEGNEPPPAFYDECDRRGIMLWHDFWFNGGQEPTDLPAFAETVRIEIEDIVRRLRNHPSLLLWCGGNENHMFVDWAHKQFNIGGDLFLKTMPEIVARLDPTRYFHPNSPYGGPLANWPLEGDYHDYTTVNFEPESSVPTWSSEVLRASPPSLNSMRQYLSDEEIWPKGWSIAVRKPGEPAWPPAWTYHSTGVATWDRVAAVERYIDAAGPAEYIRALGTAHGDYLQDRVERQRRGVPDGAPDSSRRNWGNTIWRLNDPWPEIYGSAIDFYLEPKIAYYYLRRAYDPVLVSFERTPDWIAAWVTNDSPETASGTLTVRHLTFSGSQKGELTAQVTLAPGAAKRVLNLTPLGILNLRGDFLHASFNGREATLLLTAERYLHLPQPKLKARRIAGAIEISTDVFARQVSLELENGVGAAFADNYFDLPPGQSRTVPILHPAHGGAVIVKAINSDPIRLP